MGFKILWHTPCKQLLSQNLPLSLRSVEEPDSDDDPGSHEDNRTASAGGLLTTLGLAGEWNTGNNQTTKVGGLLTTLGLAGEWK